MGEPQVATTKLLEDAFQLGDRPIVARYIQEVQQDHEVLQ